MSIKTKTKNEILAALKRIPYEKVAAAINAKHLNGALREIPPIELCPKSKEGCADGCVTLAVCENVDVPLPVPYFRPVGLSFKEYRRLVVQNPEKYFDVRLVENREQRWGAGRTNRIVLYIENIANNMVVNGGSQPITAILTHELVHAIQAAKPGYRSGHGPAFEDACLFACHSGLRVDGEKNRYRPFYGHRPRWIKTGLLNVISESQWRKGHSSCNGSSGRWVPPLLRRRGGKNAISANSASC